METTNTPPRVLTRMPRRIPVNGTFELTVRCNLHCKMCMFRHDDRENPELMAKELTAAQWIDMARQAAEAGTMNLLITGGEPLLRPDFCEIWEGIYRQGFVTTLYTNATLVTPRVMETLRKYPPHKIGVTIYGASPETYGRVCGDESAFQRMVQGVHNLLLLPSQIEFRMTIIKDNKNDVIPIERFVRKEFGKTYSVIMSTMIYRSVRGACADVDSCRLQPKELLALKKMHLKEMARLEFEGKYDLDQLELNYVWRDSQPDCESQKELSLFGCKAGMSQYVISWSGQLIGCQLLDLFAMDAVGKGFFDAWEQYPFQVKLPPPNQKCQTCKMAKYCETCPAFCYAETGALNECSSYIFSNAQAEMDKYQEVVL